MRNSKVLAASGLLLCSLAAGCGTGEKSASVAGNAPQAREAPRAEAPPAAAIGPAGRLRGTVRFEGPVPPPVRSPVKSFSECAAQHPEEVFADDALIRDGKLQNVFVYVKEGLEGKPVPPPRDPVLVDQVGCLYKPRVLGVQVGQEMMIKNSDVTLHNVHSHSVNQKPFNFGMPVQGMKVKKIFGAPEVMVKLTCDVHPWMKSYVGVLPHPYFAVSGADGGFEIPDLPPGKYRIEAWHEKFGTQTQEVTVTPAETSELSFTFKAD